MSFQRFVLLLTFIAFSISTGFSQAAPPSQFKDAPSELEIPTEEELFKDDPDPAVLSAQVSVRLKKIQQTIPLDYNPHVQKYITYYTTKKGHVAKVLGRAKKFFPIFESIFAQYGIPDEMKYLAVVESALNPFAVSPKGASGIWQFMYSTGLRYDLSINKKVDERRDVYKSCDAAARYLKEMYNLYGSWQLAIASYNCGAGNVNKAINKAGGSKNFWDIRPYLPKETAAYVPSFIAMVYAMKYANKLGISPLELQREPTQRVTVREKMSVTDLIKLLGIPKEVIVDENPSLLTTLIPADFTLNLPVSKITSFTAFQDSLYAFAEDVKTGTKLSTPVVVKPESAPKEMSNKELAASESQEGEFSTKPVTKPGKKTPVTADKTKPGKTEKPASTADLDEKRNELKQKKTQAPVSEKPIKVKVAPSSKIDLPYIVKEDEDDYRVLVYRVKKGDNLGYISQWFHCKVSEIRRWNELSGNLIDIDQELLIYVHKNDYTDFVRFDYFSRRLKDLVSARLETQEEKDAAAAKTAEKSNQSIVQRINPVKYFRKDECFEMYTIRKGDNLWIIAENYDDVSVQDLMKWNGYSKTPTLKPGEEIKVRKVPCK